MTLIIAILFFVAFIFGVGGTTLFVEGIRTGDNGMIASSMILLVIGVAALVALIVLFVKKVLRIRTIRRIIAIGQNGRGEYVGKSLCPLFSTEKRYKLKFSFIAAPRRRTVKSLRTYSFVEIAALQRTRRFAIKWHGKRAVIDEDIRMLVRMNSRAVREGFLDRNAPMPPIIRCLYCESKVKANAKDCRNCGALTCNIST
ncbi:MAG: hypothetical protein FWC80_04845 [Firmicutes bacterium]|nr:hypothetical protein [Bacillota bacterium]